MSSDPSPPSPASVAQQPVAQPPVVSLADPLAQQEANQLQTMVDQVYKQLLTLSNGCLNTSNVMAVVFQLVQDCDTFQIADANKPKVILMAIDQFCVEHGQNSTVFSLIEPFVNFALKLSNGTIAVNVKTVENDVQSCLPCLPWSK